MIIGVDPGPEESGYVICDRFKPYVSDKVKNDSLIRILENETRIDLVLIERPVCRKWAGASVSDTAIWTGRFMQASPVKVGLINRQKVRMHMVGKKATDADIRFKIIERFYPEYCLKEPGMFKGFKSDIWQAYALIVTYLDLGEVAFHGTAKR